MDNQLKYQIYINRVPISGVASPSFSTSGSSVSGIGISYGILNSDDVIRSYYDHDFYINVPLFRNQRIEEYVDVQKERNIYVMERQDFNPYYLEFGFFDTIKRNNVQSGKDLTQEQIEYIKSVRTDLDASINIPLWFDSIGKDTLPWVTPVGTITISDIDSVIKNVENILSKSSYLNIEINR